MAVLALEEHRGRLPLFGGVEDVRFRRVVRPGDELTLQVDLERLSRRGGWGRATASVEGAETCRASPLRLRTELKTARPRAVSASRIRLTDGADRLAVFAETGGRID